VLDIPINIPIQSIREYCAAQPIRKLSLFGSVLRDDFSKESDIDVLIEFEPDSAVTYFDLFDMQETLTTLLEHQVDLLTPNALSPYFRDEVLQQAVTIYERS